MTVQYIIQYIQVVPLKHMSRIGKSETKKKKKYIKDVQMEDLLFFVLVSNLLNYLYRVCPTWLPTCFHGEISIFGVF